MVAFRTITNSVANINVIFLGLMSIMFQQIIFLYLWLVFYGGPQLSRQKQIAHGNSLTAKANRSRQKQIHSRQKQINSRLYFYPADYTYLVSSVYISLPWSQRFSFTAKRRDKREKEAASCLFLFTASRFAYRTSWLFFQKISGSRGNILLAIL